MQSINETGNRYGRLLVIDKEPSNTKGKTQWRCQCDCGNTIVVLGSSLRRKKNEPTVAGVYAENW